jgi:hypothetical protein
MSSHEQRRRSRIVRLRCDVSTCSVAQARCLRYLVAHYFACLLLRLLPGRPAAVLGTKGWSFAYEEAKVGAFAYGKNCDSFLEDHEWFRALNLRCADR